VVPAAVPNRQRVPVARDDLLKALVDRPVQAGRDSTTSRGTIRPHR
jgi:hypothetical protein